MIIGLINLPDTCWKRAPVSVPQKRWKNYSTFHPYTARVVTEDGEKSVPLARRTFSGDAACGSLPAIACRWRNTRGEAWLDEAMLTEPIPQQKAKATAFMPRHRRQRGRQRLFAPARWAIIPRCHALFAWYARAQAVNRKLALADKNLRGIRSRRRGHCAVQRRFIWYFFGPAPQKLFIRWSSPPPY